MLVSVVLIALVMLQARGSGFGSMFGSDTSVYKTRRGMEKTVYNMTVLFSGLFLVLSLLTVLVG
jgi:preprotein translocase subunit SecG